MLGHDPNSGAPISASGSAAVIGGGGGGDFFFILLTLFFRGMTGGFRRQ